MTLASTSAEAADGEAGFTLVEVLVAFMIIALTLMMGMQVLADGAGWARRGPAQADRVEEAASVMNQLIADPHLGAGDTAGALSDGSRWFARLSDVTARVMPNAGSRLVRVELFLDKPAGRPLFVTLAAAPSR